MCLDREGPPKGRARLAASVAPAPDVVGACDGRAAAVEVEDAPARVIDLLLGSLVGPALSTV